MTMAEVSIRNFEPRADNREIANITCEIFIEDLAYWFKEPPTDLLAEAYPWLHHVNPETFLIAEVDGKVVGFIRGILSYRSFSTKLLFHSLLSPLRIAKIKFALLKVIKWALVKDLIAQIIKNPYDNAAVIEELAVHKYYRRAGIGKALIDSMLCILKKKGAKEVRLEVRHDNKSAIQFYKKVGFVQIGVHKGSFTKWLIMAKVLDEESQR